MRGLSEKEGAPAAWSCKGLSEKTTFGLSLKAPIGNTQMKKWEEHPRPMKENGREKERNRERGERG